MTCLAQLSRLDLAALAMTSKIHRSVVVTPELWDLRWEMGCIEPSLYVWLHIFPEPTPRWFILHPVQRRLKPIYSPKSYQAPESSASFVVITWGIYLIGGLINGNPTSDVSFFDCSEHRWYHVPPMKMARASASASLIDGKIYVFGGLGDDDAADTSNWAEVYDLKTQTWDFLFVHTPKMPRNIQQSVVIDQKEVYAVDEDGQSFSFSPSECVFVASGKTDSKPEGQGSRNDWCLNGKFLFSRGTGGKILWCLPYELDWKEVKGLEELQHSLSGFDICKLCNNYAGNIVIFWYTQPQGPDESFDLWSAEISLEKRQGPDGCEIWGKTDWSAAVFKLDPLSDSNSVKVLYAHYVYA